MTVPRPNHIRLPTQPSANDIFSTSALDSKSPSPSSSYISPLHVNTNDEDLSGGSHLLREPMSGLGSLGRMPQRPSSGLLRGSHSASSFRKPSAASGWVGRRQSRASTISRRLMSSVTAPDSVGEIIEQDPGHPWMEEPPAIPALVPGIRPAYSTPLPYLPMLVLCIAMMSEFLSANVCTPFLLQMVEGFYVPAGEQPTSEVEGKVGMYTGNLVSVFFVTQFFTSLLWSSIANKHGRRAVLIASLLGSAVTVILFGTSGSYPEAISVRLAQGVFGGSIGVFRGSVRDITDTTNEGRAYAMLGFAWGMGGVVGPILGGLFESPAENHPGSFLAKIAIFQRMPYLLPGLMAGAILAVGAVLACFLSWDGGPTSGRIALTMEKLPSVAHRTSSIMTEQAGPSTSTSQPPDRVAILREAESRERMSRASRGSLSSAYGYGGIRSRHQSIAARRLSDAPVRPGASEETEHLTLGERILMANEENNFNLNDIWVSAAIAQETDVFEDDDEDSEEYDEVNETSSLNAPLYSRTRSMSPGPGEQSNYPFAFSERPSRAGQQSLRGDSFSRAQGARHSSPHRRPSAVSGHLPAIFANTGLNTPPAIAAAYEYDPIARLERPLSPLDTRMDPIHEHIPPPADPQSTHLVDQNTYPALNPDEKIALPAGWRALPMLIILQYGLLALHDTVHGQVFLSFLVSKYNAGGLGLQPSGFSILIAMMCCFQLYYQFYLYPHIGPPRGKLNHLQMFRLGSMLFIPAYLTLPMLRTFASPDKDGGFVIMTLITINMACRYAGGTFSYTSVMVLINAMSPPEVVGLSNGLAQSLVSLGRFVGPVIGGTIWSTAINSNPDGYFQPFYIVAALCAAQVMLSYLIR